MNKTRLENLRINPTETIEQFQPDNFFKGELRLDLMLWLSTNGTAEIAGNKHLSFPHHNSGYCARSGADVWFVSKQ